MPTQLRVRPTTVLRGASYASVQLITAHVHAVILYFFLLQPTDSKFCHELDNKMEPGCAIHALATVSIQRAAPCRNLASFPYARRPAPFPGQP